MLTKAQVAEAAAALHTAELENEPITPISETYPDADVEDAYKISMAVTELKLKAGRLVKGPQNRSHVESDALAHRRDPSRTTARMFDDWFVLEAARCRAAV